MGEGERFSAEEAAKFHADAKKELETLNGEWKPNDAVDYPNVEVVDLGAVKIDADATLAGEAANRIPRISTKPEGRSLQPPSEDGK